MTRILIVNSKTQHPDQICGYLPKKLKSAQSINDSSSRKVSPQRIYRTKQLRIPGQELKQGCTITREEIS
jgi:hypothetical protein